ncbi:hypothetical protein FACS1894132_13330 [Clostridia bacterium]|nr:hypothetical protein FACS1894132_13330 [Clostridia bacterium]
MIEKPVISPNFTIEDIHKIREYNHMVTKDLSFEERRKYYSDGATEFEKIIVSERQKISKNT